MNIKMGLIAGTAILSLAACGGGSGGGVTTPPPGGGGGSSSNSSLSNLTVTETFPTTSGTVTGTINNSSVTGVTSAQTGIGSAVQLTYNSSDGSYRLQVDQAGVTADSTFTASDIASSPSTLIAYTKTSGSIGEQFLLYKPGNSTNTFNYVSYGGWQRLNPLGSKPQLYETSFFAFGVRTPASSMPSTGTANYSAIVDGYLAQPDSVYSLSGSGSLAADFGAGSVTGEFTISKTKQPAGTPTTSLGSFHGTSTISGNTFGGAISSPDAGNNYAGTWNGGFFGPSHQEVGGTFRLVDGDNQAVGGFIGN